MNKILIPVDFSEHTPGTARFAIEMARALDAEVLLLHVVIDNTTLPMGIFPDSLASQAVLDTKVLEQMRLEAERSMHKLIDSLISAEEDDLPIRSEIVIGDPDLEIQEFSLRYQPDLIVIGARGKGGKDCFSGGTAEKLMRHTHVPVMAVPVDVAYQPFRKLIFVIPSGNLPSGRLREMDQWFAFWEPVVYLLSTEADPGEDPCRELEKCILGLRQPHCQYHIIPCKSSDLPLPEVIHMFSPDLVIFPFQREGLLYRIFHPASSRREIYKAHLPILTWPAGEQDGNGNQ